MNIIFFKFILILTITVSSTVFAFQQVNTFNLFSNNIISNNEDIIDPIFLGENFRRKINVKIEKKKKKALGYSLEGELLNVKSQLNKIYTIAIKGVKKINPDVIILQLFSKVGEKLNNENIKKDVRIINKFGFFSDVKVLMSIAKNNSIKLIFKVKEKPLIHKVKINGVNNISKNDFQKLVNLKTFQIADESRIIENLQKIRKKSLEKGFHLVTANYKLLPIKKKKYNFINFNFVDVIFTINENIKSKIGTISFVGNKYLSSNLIKNTMNTKEEHLLSYFNSYGKYYKSMFKYDLLLIEKLYHDYGYLNVLIENPKISVSNNKKKLFIVIPLIEGKSYKLGKLEIVEDLQKEFINQNNNKLSRLELKKKLLRYISLKEGEIFNESQFYKDIIKILNFYKNNGYAYVNIIPKKFLNDKEHIVNFKLKINSGPKIYIERIDINGNNKTTDSVIRREIRIYEGELYSSTMIAISKRNIMKTGFFKSLTINNIVGTKLNHIILDVKVKERSGGKFQFNMGIGGNDEGVILNAIVAQDNLFGRGQNLTANFSWSYVKQIFNIKFIEPFLINIANEPLVFSFSAHNTKDISESFFRFNTGGDISLGYAIGRPFSLFSKKWIENVNFFMIDYVPDFENLHFFLTYNIERIKVKDKELGVNLFGLHTKEILYTTSIKSRLIFDQRNDKLFPSKGWMLEFQSEFAFPIFGSKILANIENKKLNKIVTSNINISRLSTASFNNFFRLDAMARFYFPLLFLVGKLNFNIGYINTFNRPLIFENYFIGGPNTVRGYPLRSLGPIKYVTKLNSEDGLRKFVMGGNKQFIANFEIEFPIIKSIKLFGVIFFDCGNVFSADENFFYIGGKSQFNIYPNDYYNVFAFTRLYSSVGFGFRWLSPMGLLRFEWGFPLTPRPCATFNEKIGDDPVLFQFNFGPSF